MKSFQVMEFLHLTQRAWIQAPLYKATLQEITSAETFHVQLWRGASLVCGCLLNCWVHHILFSWRWKRRSCAASGVHVCVCEFVGGRQAKSMGCNMDVSSEANCTLGNKQQPVHACDRVCGGGSVIQTYNRKRNLCLGKVFCLWWTSADVWHSWKI